MRGHPELRQDRDSWDMLDWMNQLEHRIAEAEYGEEGGVDALDCFHIQGKWRLEWREQRIPSMTMDALDHIQLESLAAGAAAEQRKNLSEWDWRHTYQISLEPKIWARKWDAFCAALVCSSRFSSIAVSAHML